jgi:hypothetical protein
MRPGRVIVNLDYPVDLDDQEMVDQAISCLVEDIKNAIKYGEDVSLWLTTIEDYDIHESDIPSFLRPESHWDE